MFFNPHNNNITSGTSRISNVQIYADDWETMLFRLILLLYGPWISVLTRISILLDCERISQVVDATARTARNSNFRIPTDRVHETDIFMISLLHMLILFYIFSCTDYIPPPPILNIRCTHPAHCLTKARSGVKVRVFHREKHG